MIFICSRKTGEIVYREYTLSDISDKDFWEYSGLNKNDFPREDKFFKSREEAIERIKPSKEALELLLKRYSRKSKVFSEEEFDRFERWRKQYNQELEFLENLSER